MRTLYDSSSNEVWVIPVTSLFPEPPPGEGGENDPPGGVGTPPGEPVTPPVAQGTNWEAAYKTLQRNHTTLQTKADTVEGQNAQLTTDLATRANEYSDANSALTAANELATGLQTQIDTLTAESGNLSAELDRNKLIMGEFPQLASFEAQGLLPQAEGDEAMRDVFTKFAATIDGIRTTAVENLMAGASVEPVGGEGDGDGKPVTLTADQLWNKVVQLSGDHTKSVEYEQVYQEYLAALATEQGSELTGIME